MIPKTQGWDESVNQAPRLFVEAISAIDNASGLIAGVGLIDDDQDDDSEVVNQHSLKTRAKDNWCTGGGYQHQLTPFFFSDRFFSCL